MTVQQQGRHLDNLTRTAAGLETGLVRGVMVICIVAASVRAIVGSMLPLMTCDGESKTHRQGGSARAA